MVEARDFKFYTLIGQVNY